LNQRDSNPLDSNQRDLNRRDFVRVLSAGVAAAACGSVLGGAGFADEKPVEQPHAESLVKLLYDSLTPAQKEEVCFAWDHTDDRGLLRTHVSNNWNVTDEKALSVGGSFFNADQQELIREIFFGLYSPEWREKILKQLQDDAGGYGKSQTIALFGDPHAGPFQFLMTGRHLTIRCDGNSADHVAFGGPIFYGHAASGFNEPPDHPGNVFWPQALKANKLYQMLHGKQREKALVLTAPSEAAVGFRRDGSPATGLRCGDLSADQKSHAQEVLKALLEPYRTSDRDEALQMLKTQGGLDECRLSFYRQASDGSSLDLGDDGVWDVWRLEGPSFVWHFRGVPHVHVWVNVADDASLPLNAAG
jgi:hypothetical protein